MHVLGTRHFTRIRLKWNAEVEGEPHDLVRRFRGALAVHFAHIDLFHQHMANGKLAYRYPKVQYRWEKGAGLVIGWEEAALVLPELPWLDVSARFGHREFRVEEAVVETAMGEFGVADRLMGYRLVTPILLFNQDNYRKYKDLPVDARDTERDRLLVAQVLTALRGLDVSFPERLYATFTSCRQRLCMYKEQSLVGLGGNIVTNAVLPGGFGIGHAASHGYGWIEKT